MKEVSLQGPFIPDHLEVLSSEEWQREVIEDFASPDPHDEASGVEVPDWELFLQE